ncbi:MAG TPA: CocE/NonD family hydrolase [Dehalococcoidia bacterium]
MPPRILHTRARTFLPFALVLLLLAGCGGGHAGALSAAATTAETPLPTTAPETAAFATTPTPIAGQPTTLKQKVTYQSDGLTMTAFIYKPRGAGPFPVIVWNHGSGYSILTGKVATAQDLESSFDAVGVYFARAGYVLIAPERRGQGESQGPFLHDQIAQVAKAQGKPASLEFFVDQMAGPQLDDQLAGLAYIEKQPYADTSRIAVAGCSFGGIETLLAAAKGNGIKAAVALSPGAESWDGDVPLQARLRQAVDDATIPILIIQPPKDASLGPSQVLGAEIAKLHKPDTVKVFPADANGSNAANDGHCFGSTDGLAAQGSVSPLAIWGSDALAFIAAKLK